MYPWPSFGSFTFTHTESPVLGSDTGWNRSSSHAEIRPVNLGPQDPSYIKPQQRGNAERSWECYMLYSRIATLQGYQNLVSTIVTWDRPTPDTRTAYLKNVQFIERDIVSRRCQVAGRIEQVARIRLEFVESQ